MYFKFMYLFELCLLLFELWIHVFIEFMYL